MATSEKLKAPFPYFGGKSRVAAEVWRRFGSVKTYVEPFFGSGAVLLGRPGLPGVLHARLDHVIGKARGLVNTSSVPLPGREEADND